MFIYLAFGNIGMSVEKRECLALVSQINVCIKGKKPAEGNPIGRKSSDQKN